MFESFDELMERLKATGYFIDPVMTRIVFWPRSCRSRCCLRGLRGAAKRNLAVSVAQAAGDAY